MIDIIVAMLVGGEGMQNTQQDIEVLFLSSLNIYPWEAPRRTFLIREGIGVGRGKASPVASVEFEENNS